MLKITFDPAKRDATLARRGLDFAEAALVFESVTVDILDDRRDYGETRMITSGYLRGRIMVVVWTPRGGARHVISFRKANGREISRYRQRHGEG